VRAVIVHLNLFSFKKERQGHVTLPFVYKEKVVYSFLLRLHPTAPRPRRPVPKRGTEGGSGTTTPLICFVLHFLDLLFD
jgi:hypothetical protein